MGEGGRRGKYDSITQHYQGIEIDADTRIDLLVSIFEVNCTGTDILSPGTAAAE